MNNGDAVSGDMRPFDLLQHILKQGPDKKSSHQLLGEMGGDPVQLSSIAERSTRSKSSIYRFVDPLAEHGLILEEDNRYQLTCAGASLHKEILQHSENLTEGAEYDENPLSYIIGAKIRVSILRQLSAGTELKVDLVEDCSSSRSTVQRALDHFEEYGWVSQRGGQCEALDEREEAIAAYSELLEFAQRVLDNISLLRRMGPEYADIPIEALDEAELVCV